MDFWTFLQNRGVSEEHIQKMKLDKVSFLVFMQNLIIPTYYG